MAIRRTLTSLIPRTLTSSSLPLPFHSRTNTSWSGSSVVIDASPNWTNRPPMDVTPLEGCDYNHWLVILKFDDPKTSQKDMIRNYVDILAKVVGSKKTAKKKIYSVCTSNYTGFGAVISEEMAYKLKEEVSVLWVLPDSYLDIANKDYGGDFYDNGRVIHRPEYRFTTRPPHMPCPRARYGRNLPSDSGGRPSPTVKNVP